MTTALREHAGLALSALWEVSKHFEEADTAQDRGAALQALCAESEANLAKATSEVKATKDQLAQVTAQLITKKRFIDDQYARSTAALEEHIAAAQGELSELRARIAKARQAINDTDASTGSLVKRLSLN